MKITEICVVNAFVDATPISGPAWVKITPSASRASVLPRTLQIERVYAPFFFASFIAAIVSAVSPDCETSMSKSFLERIGSLYLNSEAISVSTGILRFDSKICLPIIQA